MARSQSQSKRDVDSTAVFEASGDETDSDAGSEPSKPDVATNCSGGDACGIRVDDIVQQRCDGGERGIVLELSAVPQFKDEAVLAGEAATALVEIQTSTGVDTMTVPVHSLWVVGRAGFRVGQRVCWRGADDDIPRGTVGILSEFKSDGMASVRFRDERFGIVMEELLDGWPNEGIRPGDRVRWRSDDEEIPAGTVGTVLGFDVANQAAVVEFLGRNFGFVPHQLIVVERCQSHSDDPDLEEVPRRPPTYPFQETDVIQFDGDKHVKVHLTAGSSPAIGVVVYCPGVHGGVGPCRTPPNNYDPKALFPTLAHELQSEGIYSCRVCWSSMYPPLPEAVHGAVLATHHASRLLREQECARRRREQREHEAPRRVGVCLVGHSLGGAVVLNTARMLGKILPELNARQVGDGESSRGPAVQFELVAVCTLAAQARGAVEAVPELGGDVRKLFLHGTADRVLPCCAARDIHAAAEEPKELEILEGGEHDFYTHKAHVLGRVKSFLLESLRPFRPERRRRRARKRNRRCWGPREVLLAGIVASFPPWATGSSSGIRKGVARSYRQEGTWSYGVRLIQKPTVAETRVCFQSELVADARSAQGI